MPLIDIIYTHDFVVVLNLYSYYTHDTPIGWFFDRETLNIDTMLVFILSRVASKFQLIACCCIGPPSLQAHPEKAEVFV